MLLPVKTSTSVSICRLTLLFTGLHEPQKFSHSNELVHRSTVSEFGKSVTQVDIDKLAGHSFLDVDSVGYKYRQNCHTVLKILLRSAKLRADAQQCLKVVLLGIDRILQ